jgi:transposase
MSAVDPLRRWNPNEGMVLMIVIGTDTHKSSHTAAAANESGRLVDELTAAARKDGFERLLAWARALDCERIWALEDCRHVSGSFERFLIARGERIVRVPPKLMGQSRRGERRAGKSDSIDALAVARAALREGPESLPAAFLDDKALALRLLLDHREHLVRARADDQQRLRWHLHDLWPEFEIPNGGLDRAKWLDKTARRLARAEQTARVRIARELVAAIRQRTRRVSELERELLMLVRGYAPQLLEEVGMGPLTAAKLIGELAGAERFATDAKLARTAGVAPVPVSSGSRNRHRLDRGGNRQLNVAFHRFAVNRAKYDAQTAAYVRRKEAEGRTRMDALRCLKRHLVRRIHKLMTTTTNRPVQVPVLT